MKFKLYKVSGYEEAINSLRMSKGKFYSWEKAQEVQQLVYVLTNQHGFLVDEWEYADKLKAAQLYDAFNGFKNKNPKITGDYETDVNEFKRLLGLTFNNAMGEFKHHTLMKYIDISFFTVGLHRGAQDDLDSHAIGFNNRITRFSTRLAEIDENKLSEWYQDKIVPFDVVLEQIEDRQDRTILPDNLLLGTKDGQQVFTRTPFGYVLEKYAQVPAKNGLAKDVQRGGMLIGMASNALWKTDLFNLRYIYKMRSKLTKTHPELKEGMEQLADQIEKCVPVFGEYFRKELTDSGTWEHMNKIKTISNDEWKEFKEFSRAQREKQQKECIDNLPLF